MDCTDAKGDGNCSSSSENKKENNERNGDAMNADKVSKKVIYDPISMYYDMTGEKLMYIFNHHKFQDTRYFTIIPEQRDGTENDVARLQKSFGNIGFTVEEPCHDYTQQEILSKLEEICNKDHRNTSCIITVILTHGDGGGIVHAADMPYPLSVAVNRILKEPKLAGKPKLFFIQACRGACTDPGLKVAIDGRSVFTVPTHSDYLVMRSSFEEHVSFRSSEGSWMIQALCDVIDEGHKGFTILDMTTIVNQRVATNFSKSEVPEYHDKKQVPEVWSTLTKHLNL